MAFETARPMTPLERQANDRLRPHDEALNKSGFVGVPREKAGGMAIDLDGIFSAEQLRLVADAISPLPPKTYEAGGES